MTLLDLAPRVATEGPLADLPVVIVGAGPIGLAAAANLAVRNVDFVVLEAGAEVDSEAARVANAAAADRRRLTDRTFASRVARRSVRS